MHLVRHLLGCLVSIGVALLLMAAAGAALGQPSNVKGSLGTELQYGHSAAGCWWAYFRRDVWSWRLHYGVAPKCASFGASDVRSVLGSAAGWREFEARFAGPACRKDGRWVSVTGFEAICTEMRSKLVMPSRPIHRVTPNPQAADRSRPMYAVVLTADGKGYARAINATPNLRAPADALCDCGDEAARSMSGDNKYCPVESINVRAVTLCSETQK